MSDQQPTASPKGEDGDDDKPKDATKVQDLAKAGRKDFDPNDGQE